MRLLLLGLAGCAYHVRIESTPEGATLTMPAGDVMTAPQDVTLRWVPFGHQVVKLTAPGYRPLQVDLRGHEITFWHVVFGPLHPHRRVEIVLVPEHGPAGTWDATSEGLEK